MDKSVPAAPPPPAVGNKAKNVVLLRQADVLITDELASRRRKTPDLRAEAAAVRELSSLMAERPEQAVQRGLELAIELCGAGSAGLNLVEGADAGHREFRWDTLVGSLAGQRGVSPFDFSPSGLCLAAGRPILVSRPARAFGYLEALTLPVMEGLLVPLYDTGAAPLGTIWVVHHDAARRFDAEDARVIEQLAGLLVLAVKLREEERRADAAPEVGPAVSSPGGAALRPSEAALREADGLATLILESSRDCILVLDLQGNIRLVSPGGIEAMEIDDPQAVVGKSWLKAWRGPEQEAAQAAVAEACAGGVGRFEGFCPTHKGLPKWWDVVVSPLAGPDGKPERLVSVGRDITPRKMAEAELIELQTIQHLATQVAGIGVWELDPRSGVIAEDPICKAVFGQALDAVATLRGNLAAVHPEDRRDVERAIAAALDPSGTGEYAIEFRVTGIDDGVERWADARGRALFEGDSVQTMIGIIQDVTTRKQVEDRQRLVTHELRHRMKNTLAMVQAIANQTMRSGMSIDEAKASFVARLTALGRAQDMLTRTDWSQAGLRDVIAGALEPHGGGGPRFEIRGPALRLSAKCGLAMSLALHELATNAAKYGALSNEAGCVEVAWRIDRQPSQPMFRFSWRECQGPPVTQPNRIGFGSRLLQRSLAGYFNGSAELCYAPEGVAFNLDCVLEELIAE